MLADENQFVVIHHNIRSFYRNFDSLSLLLNELDKNIDVLVLTETWFSEGLCCEVEGFVGYHVFRDGRVGGGVSIFVRSNISSNMLPEFSSISNCSEMCVVELSLNTNYNIKYACRHPPA